MMLLYALSIATLMHTCFAVPVDLFNLADELLDDRATDPAYRLPKDFMPERYLIRLYNINFEEGTFTGDTEVTFTSKVKTNVLKIHAVSLDGTSDISKVKIVIPDEFGKEVTVTGINYNTTYGMLTITVNSEDGFTEGTTYRLEFKGFTGDMKHPMTGFYRSKYVENGKVEWLGASKFQPGHARQAFPCFDEPYFKAKFILSIERPDGYNASIANVQSIARTTDQDTKAVWDHFEETPVMSTYLVAFIVSKYNITNGATVNGNTFRILARPSAAGQGSYAFKEGQELENKMSDYMKLDYYTMGIKKMDQAAIPDFLSGAMENWGLIMYREAYLLSEEGTSSVRDRQFISVILAHEIAHMWFGNYITCHWWSDTWLNEGFARFYEYRLPDMASTDYKLNTQFPVNVLQGAMIADTSINSAPLTNPNVNSPQEVRGHFSIISYHKGASIIRMMEQWIGVPQFTEALNIYMREHKYGIVKPEDLYAALQQKASQDKNVANVMSTWVKQSGYPLITVDVNYNDKKMTLSQERFKKAWQPKQDTILYQVPITYATKSNGDFENTETDYLLTAASSQSIDITITEGEWIVLNKQQIGYYRVNYDDKTWDILRSALLGPERTRIHQINRAQIVDDVFNLAREEVISYNRTFDILDFLHNETEYAPWTSAFAGFAFIRQQFSVNPSLSKKLHDHIFVLVNKLVKETGFTNEGDFLTQLFRLNTMNFACSVGHKECVDYAKNTFNEYLEKDVSVPANHREFVYCTGLREGNAASYDKLWTKYKGENVAGERVIILGALGCTKDEAKIIELLDEISKENSEIRVQDVETPINSILNGNLENTEYVLKYLENDFMKLRNGLGSYSSLFTNLGSKLTGNQIRRFNDLININAISLTHGELSSGRTAYNNLLNQRDYLDNAGEEIEAWLDERYKDAGVLATSSFMLLCVVLLAHLFNVQL